MKENFLLKQTKVSKWLFRHNDNIKMKWDIFVILLAFYNCISIPFDVAFEPETPDTYLIFERIVDFCFGFDIIIAFRTTFISPKSGLEVTNQK